MILSWVKLDNTLLTCDQSNSYQTIARSWKRNLVTEVKTASATTVPPTPLYFLTFSDKSVWRFWITQNHKYRFCIRRPPKSTQNTSFRILFFNWTLHYQRMVTIFWQTAPERINGGQSTSGPLLVTWSCFIKVYDTFSKSPSETSSGIRDWYAGFEVQIREAWFAISKSRWISWWTWWFYLRDLGSNTKVELWNFVMFHSLSKHLRVFTISIARYLGSFLPLLNKT